MPLKGQGHLLHHLPHGHVTKQGQTNDQPDGVICGQLATTYRCFATGMQRLLDPLWINQRAQLGHGIGGQRRQGLIQGFLQYGSQTKKGA